MAAGGGAAAVGGASGGGGAGPVTPPADLVCGLQRTPKYLPCRQAGLVLPQLGAAGCCHCGLQQPALSPSRNPSTQSPASLRHHTLAQVPV